MRVPGHVCVEEMRVPGHVCVEEMRVPGHVCVEEMRVPGHVCPRPRVSQDKTVRVPGYVCIPGYVCWRNDCTGWPKGVWRGRALTKPGGEDLRDQLGRLDEKYRVAWSSDRTAIRRSIYRRCPPNDGMSRY